jgi:hypothetical protein
MTGDVVLISFWMAGDPPPKSHLHNCILIPPLVPARFLKKLPELEIRAQASQVVLSAWPQNPRDTNKDNICCCEGLTENSSNPMKCVSLHTKIKDVLDPQMALLQVVIQGSRLLFSCG